MNSIQCSSGTLSVSVAAATNRINSPTTYTYDVAGNMTNDTFFAYAYDAENRIGQASGMSGGPYCYAYDGNGLRVSKKSNAGSNCSQGTITTIYWRAITGETIAESDSSGATLNEYVFFAGRRTAWISSGTVRYLYSDHLGTTRSITDASGNVCYDADYTPYGQEIAHTTTCSPNYKFTGYERDPETGLDYAFARYYNWRTGRFMTADPLGGDVTDPQSLNGYAYVTNDPMDFTDPFGLKKCDPDKEICCKDTKGNPVICPGPSTTVIVIGSAPTYPTTVVIWLPAHSGWGWGSHGAWSSRLARRLAKAAVCALTAPLQGLAQANQGAVAVGGGATAGVGLLLGVSGSAGLQVGADPSGNVGLLVSLGGNPGFGVFGAGAQAGVQGTSSNAQSLSQLGQWSAGVNGSVGPVSVAIQHSQNAPVTAASVGAGVGVGIQGAAAEASYTWVFSTRCP